MKISKKLTIGLFGIAISIITLFSIAITNLTRVSAIADPTDTSAGTVDVWYKTYDKTDYDILSDFYSYFGYDYDIAKHEIDTYDYLVADPSYGQSVADDYWNGTDPLIDTTQAPTAAVNTDMWASLGFINKTFTYRSGRNTITDTVVGLGKTYDEVKADVLKYEGITEKTEFEVGKTFVLLVYMQLDGLNNATLYYDNTFSGLVDPITSTMSSGVINADTTLWTAKNYTGAFDTPTGGVSGASGSIKVGGQKSDGNDGEDGKVMIGGLELTISNTATAGKHKIQFLKIDDTVVQTGDATTYLGSTNSGSFNERTVEIDVKSASNLSKVELTADGNTFGAAYSSVGSASVTGVTDPVSYDLWEADDIYTKVNDANLTTTIDYTAIAGATIDGVSGMKTSIAAALQEVVGATDGSGSVTRSHNVSVPFTTTEYTALKISGKYYVIKFERKKYTDNDLTGFAFVGTDSAVNSTKYTLSPATFNSGTQNYDLYVPSDATTIDFTPTFDTTKGTTAKVGTTNLTSGTTATGITLGSTLTIAVTSQAGVTKNYQFTIKALSTDDVLNISLADTTLTLDTSGSPTYVVQGLKYANNSFVYTPSTSDGKAKITIGTGTVDVKGTAQTFSITGSGFAAISSGTQTVTIKVLAEAATTPKVYTLTFERAKADETNTLSGITATANAGLTPGAIALTLDPSDPTNMTYIATAGDLDYTTSSYTITATSADTTSIKINSNAAAKASSTATINFSTVNLSSPTCDILVTAENTGFTNTYHVKINRAAADSDDSYSIVHIYGTDASGNTIYGYNGDTAVTVNAGFATSFQDKYGFTIDPSTGNISNDTSKTIPTSVRDIIVKLKATSTTTKIKIGGTDYNDTDYTFNLNFVTSAGADTTKSFNIVTQADGSGAGTAHTISAFMDAISIDSALSNITATGTLDTSITNPKAYTYNSTSGSTSDTAYSYQMEAIKNTQYTLSITKHDTKSKVYYSDNINDFTGAVGSSTFTASEFTNGSTFNIKAYNSTDRLYLCVVAEADGVGGATRRTTYTVDVRFTDTRSSNATINDVKVYGIDKAGVDTLIFSSFNNAVANQTGVTVDYSTVQLRFEVTFDDSTASLVSTWGITNMTNGNIHSITGGVDTQKVYTIQAVAENTTTTSTEYKFPITRKAARTGQAITSLTANTATYDESNSTSFVFGLARNVLSPVLALTVSDGAIYSITTPGGSTYNTSGNIMDGLVNGTVTAATITVTSEKVQVDGGAPKTYTVYFINADRTNVIDNIQILSKDEFGSDLEQTNGTTYIYSAGVDTIPFTIPYRSENPYFKVIHSTTANSTISGDGAQTIPQNATTIQNKQFTITSTSEYGKLLGTISGYTTPTAEVLTYKYNFTRQAASTVNTLSNLAFDFSGSYTDATYTGEATISALPNPVAFENLTNTASVTITFTKTDPNSVVTISGKDPFTDTMATTGDGTSVQTLNVALNTTSYVTITCTAENGTSYKQWSFAFAYSTVTLEDNGATKKITLEGDVTNGDILGFNSSQPSYSVHLSGKNTKARVIVTPDSSLASVTIDGNAYSVGSIYEASITPGNSTTINVSVLSQKGVDHSDYSIEVICDALSEDARLISVKTSTFDGSAWSTAATLAGFDKDKLEYEINVTYDVQQFKIEPLLNDSKATIVANTADSGANLQIGTNNFTVTVRSEAYDASNPNPDHTKEYKFTVIKDDNVELYDARFTEVGKVINLIDFANPASYTFTIPYKNDKLDFSYQTFGKAENLKVVVKNTTTGRVIPVTVTDDGSGYETSTGVTDELVEGTNVITIRIEAKSTAYKLYTFTITRTQGLSNNYIVTYVDEEGNNHGSLIDVTNYSTKVVDSTKPIEYVLPRTYDGQVFSPTITVADGVPETVSGQKYTIVAASTVYEAGKNTYSIKVAAENGDERTYNVVVYVVDTLPTIEKVTLTDTNSKNDYIAYNDTDTTYPINVAYSINSGTLEVKLDSAFAKVKLDGTEMSSNGSGKYTTAFDLSASGSYDLVIESEYYQYNKIPAETKKLVLEVNKAAANTDTTLKELVLTVGEKTYDLIKVNAAGVIEVITPEENKVRVSGNDFVIANVGTTASTFNVKATPNKAFPYTNLHGLTYSLDKSYGQTNTSFAVNTSTQAMSFSVYDEANENPNTFTITVFRGDPVKPEDNNNINRLLLTDSAGQTYIGDGVFNQQVKIYKLGTTQINAISYGKNKTYTITAVKDLGSYAKVYIDGLENAELSKQYIISYPSESNDRSYVVATTADADLYYSFTLTTATETTYKNYYFYDADIQKYISANLLKSYNNELQYYTKTFVNKSSVTTANYSNFYVSDTDYVSVHTVYAISQNGANGIVYTIYVVGKAATIDATLKDIQVNSTSISTFKPTETTYNLGEYGNTPTTVNLCAETSDANATVSVTITNDAGTQTYTDVNEKNITFNLETGNNTFTYLVTAEDGVTTKAYTVKYFRQYPNPELIDLKLDEYTFYSDSALKFETLFSGSVNQYYSKVIYGADRVIVTTTLEDATKNYDVTPSGNATVISNNRGSLVRTFYVYPQVGMGSENRYTFTVTSNNGLTTPYTIWIKRNSEITASTDIATVNEVSTGTLPKNYNSLLRDEAGEKVYESINDLGNDLLKANNEDNVIIGPYLLPNDQTSLDIKLDLLAKVKDANSNAKYELINNTDLPVGDNVVVLKITSDDKKNTQTILINVCRLDYEYDITSPTIPDFDQDNILDSYTVPASTSKVEFNVTNLNPANNIETTYNVLNGQGLKFGNNEVIVEVTSYRQSEKNPDVKVVDNVKTIKVNVNRENYDVDVAKTQADLTADDIIALNTKKADATSPTRLLPSETSGIKIEQSDRYLASVTVPSNITNIGADLISIPGFEDATVKVLNGNLPIGESEVTFVITSKDGLTTKEYTISVNRSKMKFNVVTPDEKYTIESVASRENHYTINLGHNPATKIADYTKAITFDANTDDLSVELLTDVSDKTNEVVLKVTNKQNTSEVEYVHIQIETTATTGGSVFDIIFWIVLGITIILLIIILICVNRDKYGAISKKRKNA